MSKRKQQKNGFFYYMLDMQQDFKQQGRIVPMRDMPIFAGPSWSKLSDAQKHKYNIRAKSSKNSPQAPAIGETGKRDCSGRLISVSHIKELDLGSKRSCQDYCVCLNRSVPMWRRRCWIRGGESARPFTPCCQLANERLWRTFGSWTFSPSVTSHRNLTPCTCPAK